MRIFLLSIVALILYQIAIPDLYSQGRVPTATVLSASGTRVAGIRKSTWIFSATFAGTVLGVSFPANSTIDIDAPNGETLAPIVYTVTAGSITILEIR